VASEKGKSNGNDNSISLRDDNKKTTADPGGMTTKGQQQILAG
jgi:hypothetical protein